jgi:hypothetical protein
MRCSASPTTFTAAEPDARDAVQRVVAAVVFREILKPLSDGAGPLGDVVAGSVADALAGPVRPGPQRAASAG